MFILRVFVTNTAAGSLATADEFRTPVPNGNRQPDFGPGNGSSGAGLLDQAAANEIAIDGFERVGQFLACPSCTDAGQGRAGTLRSAGSGGANHQKRFKCSICSATFGPAIVIKLVEAFEAQIAVGFLVKRSYSPGSTPSSISRPAKAFNIPGTPSSPTVIHNQGFETPAGLNTGKEVCLGGKPPAEPEAYSFGPQAGDELAKMIRDLNSKIKLLEEENAKLRASSASSSGKAAGQEGGLAPKGDPFYDGTTAAPAEAEIPAKMVNPGVYKQEPKKKESNKQPKGRQGKKKQAKKEPKPKRDLVRLEEGIQLASVAVLLPQALPYGKIRQSLRLAGISTNKVLDISRRGRHPVYDLTTTEADLPSLKTSLGRLRWNQVRMDLASDSIRGEDEMFEAKDRNQSKEQAEKIVRMHVRSKAAAVRARPDATFVAFLLAETWADVQDCFPEYHHETFHKQWTEEVGKALEAPTGKLVDGVKPAGEPAH